MTENSSLLPIYAYRDAIVTALKERQTIIVAGETGSGKSTLLPHFCRDAGFAEAGIIAITEPRRIAALSLANYAAKRSNSNVGEVVGYAIRYHRKIDKSASILYMTDGVLKHALLSDPLLQRYSVIIIDEAHERTLTIDLLLGYLRILLKKRPELRLVIASATLDTHTFTRAFGDVPVIVVEGRRFPVTVTYKPVMLLWKGYSIDSFIEGAVRAVEEIITSGEMGDILIFLPTVDDILETINRLRHRIKHEKTAIFPLHGRLTVEQQHEVFETLPVRKIVVATNIAETSLTVPGIRFVIDSGLVRMLRYEPRALVSRMPVEKISRASAVQRMGRCGRVRDGICIRLYSEADFEGRPPFTLPEIMRVNCAGVLLHLHALKSIHPSAFPFIKRPAPATWNEGYRQLRELGALDKNNRCTRKGYVMARLPLDPPVACMLLAACEYGVLREMLVIAAALSATDPLGIAAECSDKTLRLLIDPDSDFITYVNVWDALQRHLQLSSRHVYQGLQSFAGEHGLHPLRLQEWIDAHDHLKRICKEQGMSHHTNAAVTGARAIYEQIHKCLLTGLIDGVAFQTSPGIYEGIASDEIRVAGHIAARKRSNRWLLFYRIVETDKIYGVCAASIEPVWIEQLFRTRCTYRYENPWYDPDSGMVMVHEEVSFHSLVLVRNRTRPCNKVDPVLAREVFIREALVGEMVGRNFTFLQHNKRIKEKIVRIGQKLRNVVYAGDEVLEHFYDERLGECTTRSQLVDICKQPGMETRLCSEEADLSTIQLTDLLDDYPDEITLGSLLLPVDWKYSPEHDDDGATITIPETVAEILPLYYWEWLLPLFARQRAVFLVDQLTQYLVACRIDPAEVLEMLLSLDSVPTGYWIEGMCAAIESAFGCTIDRTLITANTIPRHLWLRVKVYSGSGTTVAVYRPPFTLRLSSFAKSWQLPENSFLSPYNHCETFPAAWEQGKKLLSITQIRSSKQLVPCAAWPALHVTKAGVSEIRMYMTCDAAQNAHAASLTHLLEQQFADQLSWEIEQTVVSESLRREAQAVGVTGDRSMLAERLLIRYVLALPDELPAEKSEYDAFVASAARKIDTSSTHVIATLTRSIGALKIAGERLRKRKDRYASSTYQPLFQLFEKEYRRYLATLTDENISFDYIAQLPKFCDCFVRRMDTFLYNSVKYRQSIAIVEMCHTTIDDCSTLTGFTAERLREKLRWSVERFWETLLTGFTKQINEAIEQASLEKMRTKLVHYRDQVRCR